jgi:hypothetical protein
MRPVLQNMLAAVNGGAETAFIIKKETLRELLLELKDMCIPAGAFVEGETPVICRPNRAGAGFTLSVPSTGADDGGIKYLMGDGLPTNALQADSWDVTAPPPGTSGVAYAGPRIFGGPTSVTPVTVTDSNGDTSDWETVTLTLATREMSFDASGRLVYIYPEDGSDFTYWRGV